MDASEHPIRAYRLAFDPPLRLEDLAERLETTKANLSRIETGKQKLTEELLFKAVAETGISARHLRPDLAKLFSRTSRRARHRRSRAAA
jgi:transcriptional regulator with XRE-family HTH domain